jgi:acetoin utilization protein AcuB
MTIDTIMSRDVVTVSPDTALMEIRSLLNEHGFRHLLVAEADDTLCGVISNRDVLQALSPFLDTLSEEHRDVKTLSKPAAEIMRSDPLTIEPGTSIKDAAQLLLNNRISSLPVVNGNVLVGIVTTKDLLEHYTNEV